MSLPALEFRFTLSYLPYSFGKSDCRFHPIYRQTCGVRWYDVDVGYDVDDLFAASIND